MQIQNERSGASLVIRVSGRLDSVSTPTFEAHCQQAIAQGERSLILDFRSLDYLSSAGLRSILIVAKSVGAAGGEFALANARGMVREVFEISGFLGIFRCLDSFETPAAQD
ncbi:MAG TPA: STAS domain-containing protein [Candidatus Anammoximicrobium sp.]|nr:STAS domain-containing protein [Candidatus Anammoximicrobium sp.]